MGNRIPSEFMQTQIVVPCYNEASRLDADAFARFAAAEPDYRFLFIDDGSTDGTRALLTGLAQTVDRFDVLALDQNGGKAEAVRQGVIRSIEAGAEIVGYFDADLATPLAALPQLRSVFTEHPERDIVMAARVMLLGRKIRRNPARHYAGRAFATCASLLLDLPVYDTQCGAKLLRVNDALRDAVAEPFISGWIFDVELLRRLQISRAAHGLTDLAACTYEFALDQWEDVAGSKVNLRDFPVAFVQLGQVLARYGR